MLSTTIFLIVQFLSIQGAMVIVLEDVVCPIFSEEYFTEPDTYLDEHNGLVLNFTIIKTFPEATQGHFALVGASMGEYIVNTGIDVQMDLCDMLEEPIILGRFLRVFGFSEDNCPPKIGVYGSEGYEIPTDTLPDDFPPNKYLAIFEILGEGKSLIVAHIYFSIQ
ncbi:uncharacterized protein LOC130675633 [Microplitis mediator]|uniref:uncharacterized protein LOC130675633 n=1 Tax=Microplitis mediator TaxID=375433 RepID=UPI0025526878|nr:uncharacterized protein LOC130675633 [Microplitis mediator]